ncbi:tripartite tricarboxylate transporter TctB family protein [Mesorhizobium sp. CAU 1741]|uniref:tripartite tricarboxylate transporter TctB family protein n=1 Tax=Mesorhizobium sp. CAU 1741 TaxID=3140366 RepID=UPI00325B1265
MMIMGRRLTDVMAGLTMSALGIFVLASSSGYAMGTARDMGPGYFPTIVGFALVLFGPAIIVIEGRNPSEQAPEFTSLRSILLIIGSITAFALMVERFGLAPATFVAVMLSSFADRSSTLPFSLMLAAIVSIVSVLLFMVGLGVQVDAVRW